MGKLMELNNMGELGDAALLGATQLGLARSYTSAISAKPAVPAQSKFLPLHKANSYHCKPTITFLSTLNFHCEQANVVPMIILFHLLLSHRA